MNDKKNRDQRKDPQKRQDDKRWIPQPGLPDANVGQNDRPDGQNPGRPASPPPPRK